MSSNVSPIADRLTPSQSPEPAANAQRPVREFDPSPYLRQLRGRGGSTEYLDVRHRLLWLRTEHPDAVIVTELIRADDQGAVFKASVSIPGGGSATGHGSETVTDFSDFIEKAETKALGRALNALGFGAQFAEGEGDDPRPTPQHGAAGRAASSRTESQHGAGADRSGGAEAGERGDLKQFLAELGFKSQAALEAALGQPLKGLRRSEVRDLLEEKRAAEAS